MIRAIAVLAILSAAVSKPPTPAPTETGQHTTQGAYQNGAKPNGESKGANTSTSGHGTSGETDGPRREGSADSNGAASQWWFNFWLVIFTGALALLGFLQLLTFRWQAKVMHRQAVVMRRQLASMNTTGTDTHNLAIAAKDAAAAAISSAATAAAMVDVTRQQQRAWMAIVDVSGNPVAGKLLNVVITALNCGGTPAKHLRTMAVPRVQKDHSSLGDRSNWNVVEGALRSTGLIAPKTTVTTTAQRFVHYPDGQDREAPITKQEMADIRAGNTRLFVDGRIEYRDVFNKFHWVTFCYVFQPFASGEWHYQPHETGNDMDEPGTEGTPQL